jgi:hypothetical protein
MPPPLSLQPSSLPLPLSPLPLLPLLLSLPHPSLLPLSSSLQMTLPCHHFNLIFVFESPLHLVILICCHHYTSPLTLPLQCIYYRLHQTPSLSSTTAITTAAAAGPSPVLTIVVLSNRDCTGGGGAALLMYAHKICRLHIICKSITGVLTRPILFIFTWVYAHLFLYKLGFMYPLCFI